MNAGFVLGATLNIPALTVVVVVYLALIGYLGYRGYSGTKTSADFMLAGRRINPYVMALSYGATFISTSAIVGFSGAAALFGMHLLWLVFLNIFVGVFIAFVFFGKRTRKMGHNLDAHTFPELLGRRYDSRFVQGFAGLVIFIFMPLYTAAVLLGASRIIESFIGLDFHVSLLIFAVLVAAYVIFGGLKGVMYTDALQGTLMFVGMLLLIGFTYSALGGVTAAHSKLAAMTPLAIEKFGKAGHMGWMAAPKLGSQFWWVTITSIMMGVGIGVLAQPQLAVRFMTIRSNRELNRATLVGGLFILVTAGVPYLVGSLSNAVYQNEPEVFVMAAGLEEKVLRNDDGTVATTTDENGITSVLLPGSTENGAGEGTPVPVPAFSVATCDKVTGGYDQGKPITDQIMPRYLTAKMPPWFLYVFLVTILAAGMSTISSQFHAMGTSIGRDIYEQWLNKGRGGKATVLTTRVGMAVAIVATVLISFAIADSPYVIALVTSLFFALCATAFLPVYFAAMYWKRMTRAGAIASIVSGFTVSLFWLTCMSDKVTKGFSLPKLFGDSGRMLVAERSVWSFVDAIVIALPVSIIVAIVVSLLTKPLSARHTDRCFHGVR